MTTIELLDVCYPDYFTGYHRPVLAIPVFNNMTMDELAVSIEDELNSVYDYLTNESNGFTKTELLIIDKYVNQLKEHSMDLFIGEELEQTEEDFDSVYAYFSICRIHYNKGIKFLS